MWLKQDRGLVKVVMKLVYGSGWDRDDLSTKARSGWCWNRLISGQVNVLMTQANGRYCQADPAKDKGQCKVKIAQINDDWCVATWLVGGFVHMQKKVVCTMSHLIQVWPLNLTSFDLLWCVCVCVCVCDVDCICWCTVCGWTCYCCFTLRAFFFLFCTACWALVVCFVLEKYFIIIIIIIIILTKVGKWGSGRPFATCVVGMIGWAIEWDSDQ